MNKRIALNAYTYLKSREINVELNSDNIILCILEDKLTSQNIKLPIDPSSYRDIYINGLMDILEKEMNVEIKPFLRTYTIVKDEDNYSVYDTDGFISRSNTEKQIAKFIEFESTDVLNFFSS